MSRKARVVFPGNPHHITQRGTNKADVFIDAQDKRYFQYFLNEWTEKCDIEIWAYCIMTNHFHALLTPHDDESLGRCLHGIQFEYAQYFNARYARCGRLWQNRYFSNPVDAGEHTWSVVSYIENNPVLAGLVQNAVEWEWSSARTTLLGKPNSVQLHKWLDERERKRFSQLIQNEDRTKKIKLAVSTGKPYGSPAFVEKVERLLHRTLKMGITGRPRGGKKNAK